MEELFVPFELALKAKEKGFNDNCLRYYNGAGELTTLENEGFVPAPLYQQLQDWLRDLYNIHVYVKMVRANNKFHYFVDHDVSVEHGYPTDSFYKALNQGLHEALNLVS